MKTFICNYCVTVGEQDEPCKLTCKVDDTWDHPKPSWCPQFGPDMVDWEWIEEKEETKP